jgi:hypothetical protein
MKPRKGVVNINAEDTEAGIKPITVSVQPASVLTGISMSRIWSLIIRERRALRVLGRTPDEASPTFVMFALSSGIKLGLWSRDDVAPAADGAAGSAELALTLPDADAVRAAHADWGAAASFRPPWISA